MRSKTVALVWTTILFCGVTELLASEAAKAEIIAELKTGPEEAAAAPLQQGQLQLSLNVPLTDLASILNRYEFTIRPQAASFFGVSIDYVYIDHVTVSGLSKPTYPLRIQAPFHVVGHGNFSLDEKGVAIIDVGVRIGNDWCPLLIFDKPSVDLSSVTPAPAGFFTGLKEYIAESVLRSQLEEQLSCENLKNYIAEGWHRFVFPVTIANNTLYVGIDPHSVSVSAVKLVSDRIVFRVVVTTSTFLSNAQIAGKASSLPAPKQIAFPKTNGSSKFEGLISGTSAP